MSLKALAAQHGINLGTSYDTWRQDPVPNSIIPTEFSSYAMEPNFNYNQPTRGNWVWALQDEQVAFASSNNMHNMGTGIIWWNSDPAWLNPLPHSQLKSLLIEYVTNVVTRYKGKCSYWVPVNENLSKPEYSVVWAYMDNNPYDYFRLAFDTVKAIDPQAIRLYNDNGLEFMSPRTIQVFNKLVQLRNQGVPVDAIGFQCHLDTNMAWNITNLANKFRQTIDKFRQAGFKVFITELDVAIHRNLGPTPDQLNKQKQVYYAIMKAARDKNVHNVCCWSFSDAHTWLDTNPSLGYPGIWDAQFVKKPAYDGIVQALS